MEIIILGLSSKELGQLHLHSHRGIVKLVSVSKMKYDITFLCCPLHARLVNMNYTKYYLKYQDQVDDSSDNFLGSQLFPCAGCPRIFRTIEALRAHQSRAHNVRDPVQLRISGVVCPCCHKSFQYRYLNIRHINSTKCKSHVINNCPIIDHELMMRQITIDNKIMTSNKKSGLPRYCAFT